MPDLPTLSPNRWRYTLLDQVLDLGTGQEWHFNPVPLQQRQTYELAWTGSVRAYVGVYENQQYLKLRPSHGMFPFPFGSDRFTHARQFSPPTTGTYRVVVRVGVFNPPGRVRVGLYCL